jgi:hypothetical protein
LANEVERKEKIKEIEIKNKDYLKSLYDKQFKDIMN